MTVVEKRDNIWILLIAILIPNIGGWVGAALWQDTDWFEGLNHPVWRPPNWLFPIVWTVVYSLMGVASYFVWKSVENTKEALLPLGVYALQLIVNWLWTPLFFIWQRILFALIDLTILWVLVVLTIVLFSRVSRKTVFLLLPYITWITIALALNANYYHLNKDA